MLSECREQYHTAAGTVVIPLVFVDASQKLWVSPNVIQQYIHPTPHPHPSHLKEIKKKCKKRMAKNLGGPDKLGLSGGMSVACP